MNLNKDIEKKDVFKKCSYSQDGEDMVLASFYEEKPDYKGFYVDIGALHPFRFSNTQYFYEKGWRGVNVDATPGSMVEFTKFRPEDINIETGISVDGKDLTFYSFEEKALNSFNEEISKERIEKGWKLKEKITVKTLNLNDLLNEYLPENQKIDFMNLDVEGLDFDILKSLDWKKYKPDFLLVEDLNLVDGDLVQNGNTEMYAFLNNLDYELIGKTMRTLIFKNKNMTNLNKNNFEENDAEKVQRDDNFVENKFSRAVEILADEFGLKRTMKNEMCIDKDGNPIPWYTYPAIEYLKQIDFSDKRVFEFGSGNSSLFWSNVAKEVTSVEDNEEWYKSRKKFEKENLKLLYKTEDDYVNSILEIEGRFDVIVIDGPFRNECCKVALKKIKENSLIILDNTDWSTKFDEFAEAVKILKDANLIQVDFCGFGPINDYTWATSLFFTRKFDFESKKGICQPANITGGIHKNK